MRRSRYKPKKSSKLNYLAVIVVIGLVAYILSAGAVGNWVSTNIIQPLLSAETPTGAVTSDPTSPPQSQDQDATPAPETRELKVEAVSGYAIQVGAFSSDENAGVAADEIKNRGGAGYIIKDGLVRVLAAAYNTEAEAKTVKERLLEEAGIETSIYGLQVPALNLKITSGDKAYEAINNCFKEYKTVSGELGEIAYQYDKDSDSDAAKQQLKELRNRLRTAGDALLVVDEDGEVVSGMKELISEAVAGMDELIGAVEQGFSANLKYRHINMIHSYSELVNKLTH
ncbi:MAG: SPOR domain-containing protein [Christensenellales bacterium]